MATVPPGLDLPPGTTIPPGLSLPPGTTIPPGLLDGNMNGTEGGLFDNPNDLINTGFGDGLEGGFDLGNLSNATPFFLPQRQVPYEKAPSTSAMAGIPRFGHTHEFSYIAYLTSDNGKASDGEDYIVGLLFTGLFLFVFFLIWTAVLLIFKLRLNGFLSGEPFLNPWIDDPAENKRKEELEEDGEEYIEDSNWKKQPFRVRITFFICGLLQIIFAMLMVTKGVANLQQTTDTIQISTANLELLIDEAVQTTQNLKQVGETGYILRDQLVFDLDKENFCPDNPIFGQTQAGKDIVGAAEGAVSILDSMGDFIGEYVATLEESLEDGKRNLQEVDKTILQVEDNEWLGTSSKCDKGNGLFVKPHACMVKILIPVLTVNSHSSFRLVPNPISNTGGLIAFPYLVLSSLMMVGAIAAQLHAMTDCFLCVLNWLVLPIFIFVTFVSYIFLGLMSIAASANADFCGGESSTPDQVILDVMFRSGFAKDDLFFETVRYYANQCTPESLTDPFIFLRLFDGSLVSYTPDFYKYLPS